MSLHNSNDNALCSGNDTDLRWNIVAGETKLENLAYRWSISKALVSRAEGGNQDCFVLLRTPSKTWII
jgi:hypothetical protein